MLEKILENPDTLRGWVEVVILLVGLLAAWRHAGEQSRWQKIRSLVPDAHRLAERVAAMTPTRKDDEFVKQLRGLLTALGIELRPSELELVKAMGSAEHQSWKLAAAAASGVEVVADPSVAPGSTSPGPGASLPGSPADTLPGSP